MTEKKTPLPWDLEASFKKADIDVLMEQIVKACYELKDSIVPKYDTPWTLGTKKYGWAVRVVEKMILSNKYPFLGVGRMGLGQIFSLNGVLVSIVTDDSHNRKKHYRYSPSILEQEQLNLFDEDKQSDSVGLVWRLILDVDLSYVLKKITNGEQLTEQPRVMLVGLKDQDVVSSYVYDEVFVPELIISDDQNIIDILPEESESKPVVLSRRVRVTEKEKSQGQK